MKKQLLFGLAMMIALPGASAVAQAPAVGEVAVEVSPGKAVAAKVIEARATITKIDPATRQVTVVGPSNKPQTITAGPDVRNFDRIKVGDEVVIRTIQSLALTLVKGGKEIVAAHETSGAARSETGAAPGAALARQVEVVANVIKVDATAKVITLQGPEQVVELPVENPEQLKLIKVGDQVRAMITEAVAISVEPVKPTGK